MKQPPVDTLRSGYNSPKDCHTLLPHRLCRRPTYLAPVDGAPRFRGRGPKGRILGITAGGLLGSGVRGCWVRGVLREGIRGTDREGPATGVEVRGPGILGEGDCCSLKSNENLNQKICQTKMFAFFIRSPF